MNLRAAFDPPVSAAVLAEGKFGDPGGKTANGVVMHSDLFDAVAVIDSTRAGSTADEVLDREGVSPIPVVESVETALDQSADVEALIIGVAPAGGALPPSWVSGIETAIEAGCDVVSGLHTFLADEPHWRALADEHGVRLFDVRKPPTGDALRVADGSVDDIDASVVLTMGTDCAVGKRTTAYELYRAAARDGENVGWIATGQTGIMVGAHRGVVVDRVPSDFCAGIVEGMVVDLAGESDLIIVEGQGSLTHRAYSGVTLAILHGAWPDAVVLVTDPSRERRVLFEQWPVAGVRAEVDLIERLSAARVAALSTWGTPATEFDLPQANVFHEGGSETILDGVRAVVES